jgi:hypothetical protein
MLLCESRFVTLNLRAFQAHCSSLRIPTAARQSCSPRCSKGSASRKSAWKMAPARACSRSRRAANASAWSTTSIGYVAALLCAAARRSRCPSRLRRISLLRDHGSVRRMRTSGARNPAWHRPRISCRRVSRNKFRGGVLKSQRVSAIFRQVSLLQARLKTEGSLGERGYREVGAIYSSKAFVLPQIPTARQIPRDCASASAWLVRSRYRTQWIDVGGRYIAH